MSDAPVQLASRTCTPCRGGIPPLTPADVDVRLKELPAWASLDDATRIERHLAFKDFGAALAFVDRVGGLAESEGHHPDIRFGWGYADVSFSTHAIKGLHDNDFIMAAKVDQLLDSPVA